MASVTVTLHKGITIGEALHKEAELREATLGDVLDGTAEAERLVETPDGTWELVASKPLTAIHILRRQLVRIGTFDGPFPLELMRRLASEDLLVLQRAADRLAMMALGVASRAGETGSAPRRRRKRS